MLSAFNSIVDPYQRQARLFPGLLSIFPPLVTVLAWFPQILLSNLGTSLLTLISSCGLLYGLGSLARTMGKNTEARLLAQWGGWPTTINLRHKGPLDASTRARYHAFLSNHVPNIKLPIAAEEAVDPVAADGVYSSAIKWLKEHVRKTAPLVDKENAQYGFRRNLRGMKPIAIGFCLAAVLFSSVAISLNATNFTPAELILAAPSSVWAAIIIDIVAIGGWLIFVNDGWVRQAGDQYADALLATCDRASSGKRPAKKASAR